MSGSSIDSGRLYVVLASIVEIEVFHVSCFMFHVWCRCWYICDVVRISSHILDGLAVVFLCSLPLSLCLSVSLSAGCLCVAVGIVSPAGFPHDCEEHR